MLLPKLRGAKLRQTHFSISPSLLDAISSPITACKKKLYAFDPGQERAHSQTVPFSKHPKAERLAHGDPLSIEAGARQLLADKVSGTLLGIFLLVPNTCAWAHGICCAPGRVI